MKTPKLKLTDEQPKAKWTGSFQKKKKFLNTKTKKPHRDGRRGNFMI